MVKVSFTGAATPQMEARDVFATPEVAELIDLNRWRNRELIVDPSFSLDKTETLHISTEWSGENRSIRFVVNLANRAILSDGSDVMEFEGLRFCR